LISLKHSNALAGIFMADDMLSYHNDPAVKAKYIARMQAHMDADELIRGTGYNNGRGCAIGCILNKYQHTAFPKELGLPVWLAHFVDHLFENLPDGQHITFPLELLQAIPIGVDVEPVKHRLAILRLTPLAEANPSVREVITNVVELHRRVLAGERIPQDDWDAASSAAWSASIAAYSAASSAAWSASSAAWSASRSAARSASITKEAQNLIKLLKELK
jgi:hypothetical protein